MEKSILDILQKISFNVPWKDVVGLDRHEGKEMMRDFSLWSKLSLKILLEVQTKSRKITVLSIM